jgi:hypothetical protein
VEGRRVDHRGSLQLKSGRRRRAELWDSTPSTASPSEIN